MLTVGVVAIVIGVVTVSFSWRSALKDISRMPNPFDLRFIAGSACVGLGIALVTCAATQ